LDTYAQSLLAELVVSSPNEQGFELKNGLIYKNNRLVVVKVGSAAYKLLLPESANIHPVFHVSQLKTHVPDYTPVFTELSPTVFPENVTPNPKRILDRRLVKKGSTTITQILIKWEGIPVEMVSWEDYTLLQSRFPNSSISGPTGASGGGTVTSVLHQDHANIAADDRGGGRRGLLTRFVFSGYHWAGFGLVNSVVRLR
jgi:hypothetical protein